MPIFTKAIPWGEKCFMEQSIQDKPTLSADTVLRGEEYHFSVAYTTTEPAHVLNRQLVLHSESTLPHTVELVEQIPVRVPCYPTVPDDGNYLRRTPGLYPDLLVPVTNGHHIFVVYGELKTLFVTVKVPEDAPVGTYPVTVRLNDNDGTCVCEETVNLRVIGATLPKQDLKVTEWFYCDCISSYYGLEIFSQTHWEYIENFVKIAVDSGINTILTPVFTPPLDTAVGKERPTVQLIDVEKTDDGWRFGFERLERWVAMCNRCGVENFEVSHLFTQWGARHAPKVVAKVNGETKKVFGWETDSLSEEYIGFIRAFLTAFIEKMKSLDGADKRCLFHISDEPSLQHLEQYKAVKASIADILEGYPIIDALSNYEFYQAGTVSNPIPANDHVHIFIDNKVPDLWTYYCCSQHTEVSNRFVSMPMLRTRIIGAQMWKYNIVGFLQWGYNFWYSQFSAQEVNPFYITDGNYFAPSGDAYCVYPGPGGVPYRSLRLCAFNEALMDNRMLKLAQSLCGKEAVLAALEEGIEPITFSRYPREDAVWTAARSRIHAMIEGAL